MEKPKQETTNQENILEKQPAQNESKKTNEPKKDADTKEENKQTSLFGNQTQNAGGLFGSKPATNTTTLFGGSVTSNNQPTTSNSLFGSKPNPSNDNEATKPATGGLFSNLGTSAPV